MAVLQSLRVGHAGGTSRMASVVAGKRFSKLGRWALQQPGRHEYGNKMPAVPMASRSSVVQGFFDRNHHHLGNPRFRRSRRLAVGVTEGNVY
jgi:hypothetical protein